jgi:hypothetical protein
MDIAPTHSIALRLLALHFLVREQMALVIAWMQSKS